MKVYFDIPYSTNHMSNHILRMLWPVTNHILRMLWRYPGVRNDSARLSQVQRFQRIAFQSVSQLLALSCNDAIARSHWRRQISVVWSHRAVGTGASVRKTLWTEGERGALYLGVLYLCCLYCTTHWQIWYHSTDINVIPRPGVPFFPFAFSFLCIDKCGTTPVTNVSLSY